jgi:hypothetical protein
MSVENDVNNKFIWGAKLMRHEVKCKNFRVFAKKRKLDYQVICQNCKQVLFCWDSDNV